MSRTGGDGCKIGPVFEVKKEIPARPVLAILFRQSRFAVRIARSNPLPRV
jgi:hypothetical protein